VNPYPHKFTRTHRIDEFRAAYDPKITEKGVFVETETVKITGRVMTIRSSGAKLIFLDLEGDSAKVQLMATASNYTGGNFDDLHTSIRRGDIIGVEG